MTERTGLRRAERRRSRSVARVGATTTATAGGLAQPAARVLHHRPVNLETRRHGRVTDGRALELPHHARKIRRLHGRRPRPRPPQPPSEPSPAAYPSLSHYKNDHAPGTSMTNAPDASAPHGSRTLVTPVLRLPKCPECTSCECFLVVPAVTAVHFVCEPTILAPGLSGLGIRQP
jgi:hypothetical protein